MADDSFDVEGGLGPHDGLAPPPPPLEFATRDGNDRNPWSALFCCCFRRVGNLVVLFQLPAKPGETPRLLCVVGPYWPMMMCITTPLILAPCVGVVIYAWPFVHYGVIIGFCCFAAFTLTALWCTACSNPGLVPRYEERPPHADSNWSWNDQTRTFRPRTARYVDDCGVLVDRCALHWLCGSCWLAAALASRSQPLCVHSELTLLCFLPILHARRSHVPAMITLVHGPLSCPRRPLLAPSECYPSRKPV